MKILLLVQDKNNRSITLLAESLQKLLLTVVDSALYVWEIKDVQISDDRCSISNGAETISIRDISLAVKRTWGPIREKGLALCQVLETCGVEILNGCGFIKWSHSKIEQYRSLESLQKNNLFPQTVYVDTERINHLIDNHRSGSLAEHVLKSVYPNYNFPIVVKKDKGCRADGVYFIDSIEALQELLAKDLHDLRNGFLFQEFISSHDEKNISNYYRLNVVAGAVQSAVQFQLVWQKSAEADPAKLVDFKQANELPVELKIFPASRLQQIVDACPHRQDVVGIDVMYDGNQMYLLEYNDGPAISLIVDIGAKYLGSDNPGQQQAAQDCNNFAESIASLCFERALQSDARKQQKICYAYENINSKVAAILTQETAESAVDSCSPKLRKT